MQIKKEILLFYIMILVSAGIIIAADRPRFIQPANPPSIKCSKVPKPSPSASPFNTITDGILRYKA